MHYLNCVRNMSRQKINNRAISAELAVEKARCYAKSIVETVREPISVLDDKLEIILETRSGLPLKHPTEA